MRKILLVMATAFAMLLGNVSFAAASGDSFDSGQKTQIEQIVHDYLVNNPKVLIEASRALQMQQREEMMKKAEDAIKDNRANLLKDHDSFSGNPKGDVVLVEFFDFKCIHCKRMASVVKELADSDKNLKVVYKQLPIFGGQSRYAAKAAIAAAYQGKYAEFHEALLETKANLDKKQVVKIAKKLGLNLKKLGKDIRDPKTEEVIDENMKLAQKIGIMGTPAFIVATNDEGDDKFTSFFMPGAAQKPTLTAMIEKIRKQHG